MKQIIGGLCTALAATGTLGFAASLLMVLAGDSGSVPLLLLSVALGGLGIAGVSYTDRAEVSR